MVAPSSARQHRNKARRNVAASLVAVLAATLLQQPWAPAAAAAPSWRLKPQVDRVLPANPAKPDGAASRAWKQQPSAVRSAPVWPTAGAAEITLPLAEQRRTAGGRTVVGGLPVTVSQPEATQDGAAANRSAAADTTVSRAKVEVLGRDQTAALGVNGVVVRVVRSDGKTAPGRASVSVDYSSFRQAYGADWGPRLRLFTLSDCATSSACVPTPLVTTNNSSAGTVTAEVDVAPASAVGERATAAGTLVALAAGPSSGAGSYGATQLQPSSTWSAGGNAGDFTWNYPMRVPPSLGGPAPNISLSYSSQSVDGRMAASNNQPSWVGEGFEWEPGFIERRYKPCEKDMGGAANNTTKTSDLCWVRDNATMSLNGSSNELLFKGGSEWRGRNDDATKVNKVTVAGNGDDNGESWVATAGDGTRYFFGSTQTSTWTVPVFGNHPDEPCNDDVGTSVFIDSDCVQAWRWMLDKVVDPNGNTMTFTWVEESNKYARNKTATDLADYVRGGYLDRIDYGLREGASGTAPMRVDISVDDRCLSGCWSGQNAVQDRWPDTPWDTECKTSPCYVASPTFWSTKRLAKVTTQLWISGSTYRDVEWWTLTHSYPDPGDDTRAGLWLKTISHSGKNAAGTVSSLPDVTFVSEQKPNRVDSAQADWALPMNWSRIAQIQTETGASIEVTYNPAECYAPGGLPEWANTNTKRCYPVKWTPPGEDDAVTDWFHRYTIDTVVEGDTTTPVNAQATKIVHKYDYRAPAWHYTDDDGLIEDEDKTWSVWRGYAFVTTTLGNSNEVQQVSENRYFQGMHGDKQPGNETRSVTLPAIDNNNDGDTSDPADAPAVPDEDQYAGQLRYTITKNGSAEVSAQVSQPWRSGANASRTIDESYVSARHVGIDRTWTRTTLDGGRGRRVAGTVKTFDAYGMATRVEDLGDIGVAGDEQCTVATYEPRNTSAWLVSYPHREQSFATTCAKATGGGALTETDVLGDNRTFYDGATTHGTAPSKGNPTRTESLKSWTAGPGGGNPGTPGYLTVSTNKFDAYGRATDTTDVKNNLTKTEYTHNAAGQLVSMKDTNPLLWISTTTVDPAWGVPTKIVDANGRVTDLTYDGLGRMRGVWLPGRSKDAGQTASATYDYTISKTTETSTAAATLLPSGSYATVYTIYDALLRERQTQAPEATAAGNKIINETLYDSAGSAYKVRGPYVVAGAPGTVRHLVNAESEIPAVTTTLYDGAGRVTDSVFTSMGVEKWRTTTAYGGDRVDTTPPLGATATSVFSDVRGNTTRLAQYQGPTATPSVPNSWDETTYTYNVKTKLSEVKDPMGNKWFFRYDLRGRLIGQDDPDAGTTTSTFNDAGELTSVKDGRGLVTASTYDELGRKTTLRDNSETGPLRAKWIYDTLPDVTNPPVVLGKLLKSIRYSDANNDGVRDEYVTQTDAFNTDYSPKSITFVVPPAETGLAGTYTTNYTYWADGALSTARLPDVDGTGGTASETLSYRYNHVGLPNQMGTNYGGTDTKYVVDTVYTSYGEPTVTPLASSLGVDIGRSYEEGTRRISAITTSRMTSPSGVNDVHYSYDKAGNVTKIADLTPAPDDDNQCFNYDYLRRLVRAWTPKSGDCDAAPSLSTLAGPAPYWHEWTFDKAGNRKTETRKSAAGDTIDTYIYPPAAGGTGTRPHAVSEVARDHPGTGSDWSDTYGYDNAGNTTSRPSSPQGMNLTWDLEGQLATVADNGKNTSFVYDTDGERFLRRDSTGKTLYLPGQELRYTTAGGAKSTTRHYSYNGSEIGSRTGTSLTWYTGDHQNTSSFAIAGATGQAVSARRQTPYGGLRSTIGSWPVGNEKSFVGGTLDPTGLMSLGAREYDARLGRFISADPIMDLTDPQQINGYNYANNNPITYSDPSGERPEGYGDPIGGGRVAQSGPIDPGNGNAGYMKDGVYHRPAAKQVNIEVRINRRIIKAPDWQTYTEAFLAAEASWSERGPSWAEPWAGLEIVGHECMEASETCEPAMAIHALEFANEICKQPGVSCNAVGSSLEIGLALGASQGMAAGGGRGGNRLGGKGGKGGKGVPKAGKPKPGVDDYENPGTHDPNGGPNPYNPKKDVLPADAEEQFANSIEIEGARWAKKGTGKKAVYYRYFQSTPGKWHFSGSSNGVTLSGEKSAIRQDQLPRKWF